MVSHAEPIPRKKKGKKQKNTRLKKPVQTHHKMDILMALAT